MKKIGIFYGSTTGNTESVAKTIAEKLGLADGDVHEVSELNADAVAAYDVLLLGSSTWGAGDLQDDWYDGVDVLKGLDLSGKQVAFFGCGDSASYPDTFCGALGDIYNDIQGTGASFIGMVGTDGYTFDESASVVDGKFVGLAIDEDNESDKTEERINAWVEQLKGEMGA
ncbi:flavodoxin FldA [Alloprevotella tannerae]|uniref:flavodoxin FldA n=1 Tax=Alloprevotella tannerae TaxID=76122 RepID=UPI001EDA640D|nr:flavodoxin FldA [Alloprevotella tannerae]MCG2649504.1 flavodoxin FldA [Alloprevotella tannerae]